MPKRNLLLLCVVSAICIVAWMARDRGAHGRRFGEVMELIDRTYLEPVSSDKLFEAAMAGVFSRLDEHSAWLAKGQSGTLEGAADKAFAGVGLELSIDDISGELAVLSPVIGSPAWRAGIVAGQTILAIDGISTAGMGIKDAVAALRGTAGTEVALELATLPDDPQLMVGDDGQPLISRTEVLVREPVRAETVLGDRRLADGSWNWFVEGEPGIALVRITGFGSHTATDLDKALAAITATAPRGLILDLRGNSGGLIPVAVEVCDRFLDEGVILYTRTRRAADARASAREVGPDTKAGLEARQATPGSALREVPLVVLLDGLTAHAAEIVAASLQDHHRAVLVGSRSFGRGTMQSLVSLASGEGLLKLTTAEYLRPRAIPIDRGSSAGDDDPWGVTPDRGQEITPTGEKLEAVRIWRRGRDALKRGEREGVFLDTVADEAGSAAVLPRHIDPVLARGLAALAVGGDSQP